MRELPKKADQQAEIDRLKTKYKKLEIAYNFMQNANASKAEELDWLKTHTITDWYQTCG